MSDQYDNQQIKSYQDLACGKKAMELAEAGHKLTRSFPNEETYCMTSQRRGATVSIAATISEGYGRDTTPRFVNFLRCAQGSAKEAETHLLLCERVGLANQAEIRPLLSLADEIARIIRGLIRALEQKLEAEAK